MMISFYYDKLKITRKELYDNIYILETEGLLLHPEVNDRIIALLQKFREQLNCFKISIEFNYRGIKLTTDKSFFQVEFKDHIENSQLSKSISEFIEFNNFINSFETNFREVITPDIPINKTMEKIPKDQNHIKTSDTSFSQTINNSTTVKGKLLKTNKLITANLIQTNQVLQGNLLQSELNLEELIYQTKSLSRLSDKFDQLKSALTVSSSIIKSIENSSGKEKKQIYASLAFLGVSIVWVIWRRILKGPLKLFFWLWFRFFKMILINSKMVSVKNEVNTLYTTSVSKLVLEDAVDIAMSRVLDEL